MNSADDGLFALPMAGAAIMAALLLGILFVCLRVYGRLAARVIRGEGKVWSEPLGLPDLLVILVLSGWMVMLSIAGFVQPKEPAPMSGQDVFNSAILFSIIVGGLALFMQSRKIPVARLFGFGALPPLRTLGTAALLFAAAYPLVRLCTVATAHLLGERAESQQIVEFFVDAVTQANPWEVAAALFAGVIVAPAAEEFLFRGYLYGVIRRYLGPVAAVLLSSALFAAIHVNLLSLPALFVLAICFALAYEATGSLLVPMAMHALFNALNLAEIFLRATHS